MSNFNCFEISFEISPLRQPSFPYLGVLSQPERIHGMVLGFLYKLFLNGLNVFDYLLI